MSKKEERSETESAEGDKEKKKNSESKKEPPQEDSGEKPFDFGGLPNRDLKKNLGCGG